MSSTRLFLVLIVTAVSCHPAIGQVPGDSIVTDGGKMQEEPSSLAKTVQNLSWGDTVEVVNVGRDLTLERYLRVSHKGEEGWLNKTDIMETEEIRRYKKNLEKMGTRVTKGGALRSESSAAAQQLEKLSRGDTVGVTGITEEYFRVKRNGETGWLKRQKIMSKEEEQDYEKRVEVQRRLARQQKKQAQQRRKYFQSLREKGYSIVLTRQTFEKNTADGISVGVGLTNISQDKTVKYAKITWKLFNSVGDPTAGDKSGTETAKTRLVGPVEPGESGYTKFENVWYNPVGACAEVRGIVVEHIDGSTFTYIDDLKDIAQEAESVRLIGDCSYEAQQKRKN